ncbi:hypothetical protein Nepgr_032813 [Nepenthes gracilis]|uniref:DOMON domain-containing protein n=1 Tax=Nepenthes gracilis TaxID=150966 RepID=A0AAD3TK22_NEPGR|nr:hypothetical protein Nepgr_032813 [Nepenthes gracilis]
MASLQFSSILLCFSVVFLLSPSAYSQTCKSQKFTGKRTFETCADLPYLKAYLHWTLDSSKSSLSIAYTAPPAASTGWVGWGINPNSPTMVGSQALIAFPLSNGSLTVKPYDLKSYQSIVQQQLSYAVSNLSAESSGGSITIFATWALPAKTTKVNQVWQVGSTVVNGTPQRHALQADNLSSKEVLNLVETAAAPAESPTGSSGSGGSQAESPTGSSGSGSGSSPAPTGGNSGAGESTMRTKNEWVCGVLTFAAAFALLF